MTCRRRPSGRRRGRGTRRCRACRRCRARSTPHWLVGALGHRRLDAEQGQHRSGRDADESAEPEDGGGLAAHADELVGRGTAQPQHAGGGGHVGDGRPRWPIPFSHHPAYCAGRTTRTPRRWSSTWCRCSGGGDPGGLRRARPSSSSGCTGSTTWYLEPAASCARDPDELHRGRHRRLAAQAHPVLSRADGPTLTRHAGGRRGSAPGRVHDGPGAGRNDRRGAFRCVCELSGADATGFPAGPWSSTVS